MPTIAAEYHIEIAGVLVERELLGKSISVHQESHRLRIDLPEAADSFSNDIRMGMPSMEGDMPDERDYEPHSCLLDSKSSPYVEIRIVRVVVNSLSNLTIDGFDSKDPAHEKLYQATFNEFWQWALSGARDFVDLVRLRGQPSIEPSGRWPNILNAIRLWEIRDGNAHGFPIVVGKGGSILIIGDQAILNTENFDRIQADLANQHGPQVGELLVGEALYLVQSQSQTGPAQATLLAAMGVEVFTKDVMNAIVKEDQKEVLVLLLENPRDWSMAAHGLFHKALPTIVGHDLGPEHKKISGRVQKLFTARNKVAHRGESIDLVEAQGHVAAAKEAIELLRRLRWPTESSQGN